MKIYTYELIGAEIKTINRRCKVYIDKINELYKRLHENVALYKVNNCIDRFEFLADYVIIYMSAIMCFDALVQFEVIDASDKVHFMGWFEELRKMVY
ncbi:MAG: hypothetical protein HDT39_01350 [Lachnospiraceae bacterium]|nr:hypothetical protein [Lachnospiraceae bacterium]